MNGAILWANMHLLFWLSLIPFATGWMGENHFAPLPTALYGVAAADAGDRLLRPAAGDHRASKEARARWPRRWAAISRARSRRCSTWSAIALAFVAAVDLARHLRGGCADVADPGPPHRAGAGAQER